MGFDGFWVRFRWFLVVFGVVLAGLGFSGEKILELGCFGGVSGCFGVVSGVFSASFSVWKLGGLGGMGNIVF